MGRGDQKTAKGKRARGSYGVTRKRNENKPAITSVKKEKKVAEKAPSVAKVASEKKVAAPKKEAAEKKPATKTATAKKTTTKKEEK